MAAGVYDMYVDQGSTKRIQITYKDSLGVPISLVGYQARGQVRARAYDTEKLADLVVTITDEPNGIVSIEVPAITTSAMPITGKSYAHPRTYYYDIEVYTADDADVIRLLNGAFILSPEVTK